MDDILVLTTGGTIDKDYFDALSEYQIGGSMAARLLEVARVTQPYRIQEVMRKDSLDMSDADRHRLHEVVNAAPERRIVITHGSDTMTETARVLAGIPGKSIVLVGALSPARFAESDAAFNLGMAFACCQAAQPGTYITMNGTVFPAREVAKDRARGTFVWA